MRQLRLDSRVRVEADSYPLDHLGFASCPSTNPQAFKPQSEQCQNGLGGEIWYPCEWKYLGPRPFSRRVRNYFTVMLIGAVILAGISWSSPRLLLLIPLLGWPLVLSLVILHRASKDSYLYRDLKGRPFVGDYSVARRHLFLRVPNFSISYLRPRSVSSLGNRAFVVKGGLWRNYRIELKTEDEAAKFLNDIASLNVRQNNANELSEVGRLTLIQNVSKQDQNA